jgi:hypothetical protein
VVGAAQEAFAECVDLEDVAVRAVAFEGFRSVVSAAYDGTQQRDAGAGILLAECAGGSSCGVWRPASSMSARQWTAGLEPSGASMSSIRSRSSAVPAGGSLQARLGERFSPPTRVPPWSFARVPAS